MEAIIHSTGRIVTIERNGVEIKGRVWEVQSDSGIPIVCVITRIAVPTDYDQTEFRKELEQHEPPTDLGINAFPLKMAI